MKVRLLLLESAQLLGLLALVIHLLLLKVRLLLLESAELLN